MDKNFNEGLAQFFTLALAKLSEPDADIELVLPVKPLSACIDMNEYSCTHRCILVRMAITTDHTEMKRLNDMLDFTPEVVSTKH